MAENAAIARSGKPGTDRAACYPQFGRLASAADF
jgi:hypothetical protein